MQRTNGGVRVGATWLAVASALMIAVLAVHGPIAPDLTDQMTRITDRSATWSVVHWMAAAAFSLYTTAANYGSPRCRGRLGMSKRKLRPPLSSKAEFRMAWSLPKA